jgi:dTDP-4-amino-4,6-dideoxygalactose transaminase
MGRDIESIARGFRFEEPVYVTRPFLPPLDDYTRLLEGIWERRWLTNAGQLHEELEARLADYLGVEHLSLFCNGTIALMVALHALDVHEGEVITTPFTFPASTHVLYWNRLTPVFVDIDPATCNLDPARIAEAITPRTKAIMPVHVYGTPCDTEAIARVAEEHGLPVIYDAAHAFGVQHGGKSAAAHGDLAVLSFHATKVFTTVEGGAIVSRTAEQKRYIDLLKNFGFAGEDLVISPGINGKLNEIQAAFGLLALERIDEDLARRRAVAARYRERLGAVPGLRLVPPHAGTENGAYMPVRVEAEGYGLSRDALHAALRQANVISRRYFHPLCSHFEFYRHLPCAQPENLPQAERAATEMLCLPIYGDLPLEWVDRICELISTLGKGGATRI